MGFFSKLFGGGEEEELEETWEPEDEVVGGIVENEDGSVAELMLLSEKDSIDFLSWALEHREEAAAMLEGNEPEEEQPHGRGFWGKLFGS